MPHSESPPGMKDAFHWTRVQNSKKLFLEIITIGVKPTEIREKTELSPTETEGRRILNPGGELVEKCWRTLAGVGWRQGGKQLPSFTKVRPLPSTETGGQGASLPDDSIPEGWLPDPEERHSWTAAYLYPQKATKTKFTVASFL